MNFEYICEFYNLSYGKCYLIDKNDNYYLVCAPKNLKSYIVCSYMDDMGTMMGQNFFDTLEEAQNYFNQLTTHGKEKKI